MCKILYLHHWVTATAKTIHRKVFWTSVICLYAILGWILQWVIQLWRSYYQLSFEINLWAIFEAHTQNLNKKGPYHHILWWSVTKIVQKKYQKWQQSCWTQPAHLILVVSAHQSQPPSHPNQTWWAHQPPGCLWQSCWSRKWRVSVGKQLKMASSPSWPVKSVNQQKVISRDGNR